MDSPQHSGYRWSQPVTGKRHSLKVLNSFTRKKELFVVKDNKTIKWYSCGPTVYDVAHLGHARSYITFDIIRRILSDYFGYHVFYVMNITDIDDKIIKRARSDYLCDQFINQFMNGQMNKEQFLYQVQKALTNYLKRRSEENDPDKMSLIQNIKQNTETTLAYFKLAPDPRNLPDFATHILKLRDVIADDQDAELGHTVIDHQIFKKLTSKFEMEFQDDMQRLDVLPPSALTRVSEYIPETGEYIKKLEQNGFAYRSAGSVYFDTNKFDSDPKHHYAKLVREAFGQRKSLDEGEGELSSAHPNVKKSPNDFALWKKSKPGEPSWTTSDLDAGRPGWHIECSVMASQLLGNNFDIHSGGCDLKFPHHDNEIAQSEAYFNTGSDWVNYFIHSGHLSISGCKMSKSLKNFITIRQSLESYSSRQLRFAFLAHSWAETLDYSPNTMNTAISYEKTFKEFFLNVADTLRRRAKKPQTSEKGIEDDIFRKWLQDDRELNQEFINTIDKVDISLCDNFDTRSTLNHLSALIKECNKRVDTNLVLLKDIAGYVKRILTIFGASFKEVDLDVFFISNSNNPADISPNNTEQIFKYVEILAQFRADVRKISKSSDAQQSVKQILTLCDTLRDQTLPNLGIRLEDKEVEGASFVVKLIDAETIARERAQIEKQEFEKKLQEETKKLDKLNLQKQREDKMKISPCDMFKGSDKYSKFDDKGIPTHDSEGKEISKSALKKLQRLYAEQESRYKKYTTTLTNQ